ncbi:MAG: orotate phosphoribosyltransferase [Actinomycetota bacterium]|jgi:orotate phosphoribosyltransferase
MAEPEIALLRRICAFHIAERESGWQFGLDGGVQTRMFVDLMSAAHVDDTLQQLASLFAEFVRSTIGREFAFVAGPKRGNSLLIRETARLLGVHSAFVKQQPLFGRWIEGPVDPTSPALVIDDVASDGELLLNVVERLRDEGHNVVGAAVLIDREEGDSRQLLGRAKVDFHFMMSSSDVDLQRIRAEAARGFEER